MPPGVRVLTDSSDVARTTIARRRRPRPARVPGTFLTPGVRAVTRSPAEVERLRSTYRQSLADRTKRLWVDRKRSELRNAISGGDFGQVKSLDSSLRKVVGDRNQEEWLAQGLQSGAIAFPKPGLVGLAGKQIAESLVYAPAGLALATYNVARDVGDLPGQLRGIQGRGADDSFRRSREMGRAIAHETAEDFRNPRERPGYLIMDILGLTPLLGLPSRTAAVSRAAGAARAAGAGPGAVLRAAGARAVLGAEPEMGRLTMPGGIERFPDPNDPTRMLQRTLPSTSVPKLISRNALVAPYQRNKIARHNRALQEPQFTAPRGSALERLAARPRELMHPTARARRTFGRELTAYNRVNLEADTALVQELRGAIGRELASELPTVSRLPRSLRRGLSRGENKLSQVLAWEGDAGRADPKAAIEKWQGYYEEQIAAQRARLDDLDPADPRYEDKWLELQKELTQTIPPLEGQLRDLIMAERALDTGALEDPRFQRVAGLQREAHDVRQQTLLERGLATEEGMDWRRSAPSAIPGETIRRDPSGRVIENALIEQVPTGEIRVTPGAIKPNPKAARKGERMIAAIGEAENFVGKLAAEFEQVQNRTRPRTLEEAQARLDDLRDRYDTAIKRHMREVGHPSIGKDDLKRAQLRENWRSALVDYWTTYRNLIDKGLTKKQARIEIGKSVDPSKLRGTRKQRYEKAVKQGLTGDALYEVLGTRSMRGVSRALREQPDPIFREMRREAERAIAEMAGREPAIARALEEMDQLSRGIPQYIGARAGYEGPNADISAVFGPEGGGPAPMPRRIGAEQTAELLGRERIPPPGNAGAPLSRAKDRLAELEAQFERRRRGGVLKGPRQEVSFEEVMATQRRELEPVPGALYTSLTPRARSGQHPGYTVGDRPAGIPPPDVGRIDRALTAEFTGDSIRTGNYRIDAPAATADSLARSTRLANVLDGYSTARNMSTEKKMSRYDMPIRDPKNIPAELKALIQEGDEGIPIAADEVNALPPELMQSLETWLHGKDIPGLEGKPLGTKIDGVRWVDRRVLVDALTRKQYSLPSGVAKVADTINDAGRLAYVYGRVAYILNLPGNMGMQAITQGLFAPANYKLALQASSKWTPESYRIGAALVGEGKARAFSLGDSSSFLARPTRAAANFWSSWIDRHSRVSSLIHEMRRVGIDVNDPQAVHNFLTRRSAERTAVARRANKAIVEFNNLTEFEKNAVRHLVFIYPWSSRATLWAFRTMVEHPIKSWTLAKLGQVASEKIDVEIGELPSYLKQRGMFPIRLLGFDDDRLVNPSAINTWGTASDNGRILLGLVKGGAGLQDFETRKAIEAASPSLELFASAITGTSAYGQEFEQGALLGAFGELAKATPAYTTLRRAGLVEQRDENVPDYQKPTMKRTGLLEAIAPTVAGGLFPQPYDPKVAAARVEREKRLSMRLTERQGYDAKKREEQMLQEAKRIGAFQSTWPQLRQDLDLYRDRQIAYGREADRRGIPLSRLRVRDRFAIDVELGLSSGRLPQQYAGWFRQQATSASDDELERLREDILTDMGWRRINDLRAALREDGAVLDD